MSANANASRLKPWRPRLADVDSIIGACCRSWPPTVDDYASRIGVPPDELTRWIGKITRALKARPDALNCLRHLADLRKTGRRWPSVLPSDIQRRENALQRAKALAARMPDGWPNHRRIIISGSMPGKAEGYRTVRMSGGSARFSTNLAMTAMMGIRIRRSPRCGRAARTPQQIWRRVVRDKKPPDQLAAKRARGYAAR
jgi:hypothetical protein